jgi:hypothetical protein
MGAPDRPKRESFERQREGSEMSRAEDHGGDGSALLRELPGRCGAVSGSLRQHVVGAARIGLAGRVVVRQQDRGGVAAAGAALSGRR